MRYLIATLLESQLLPHQRLQIPFRWAKTQHSFLVARTVPEPAPPDDTPWEIHAWLNLCPHWSIPLEPPRWQGQPHTELQGGQVWHQDLDSPPFQASALLDAETPELSCTTHGARFRLKTGECIWGPCRGEVLTAVPNCHALGRIFFFLPPFMRNL